MAGGPCADATTRGALLGLRECCRTWAVEGGSELADLYKWRNLPSTFLRRDLDVLGLESYDFALNPTVLSSRACVRHEKGSSRRGHSGRGRRRQPKAARAGLRLSVSESARTTGHYGSPFSRSSTSQCARFIRRTGGKRKTMVRVA